MPNVTRTPARRRATLAAVAVGVASLAGAGSAAALPLPSILQGALPGIGVIPPTGTVTAPGASLLLPGVDLMTPGLVVPSTVVESQRLPEIVAKVKAAVAAQAEVGAVVRSVKLPSVSTSKIGPTEVRASSGRPILATPRVPSLTTPSRTPALKAKAKVRVSVKAAAKARVKLPSTPRIEIPVQLLPERVAVAPETVSVPVLKHSF